jgi:hypothetical protein
MKKEIIIGLIGLTLLGNSSDFYYENGKKIEVVKIEDSKQKKRSSSEVQYYKTAHGHKVGVKNDILVECKEGVNCENILSSYSLLSMSALSDTIFIVTIAKGENVFKFAQKLYSDAKIKLAHPNFRKNKRRR